MLIAGGSAVADDHLSYNFVQVDYLDADLDGGPDGDGVGLFGSGEIGDKFHLFGGYRTLEFDGGLASADLDILQAGFGYHRAIGEKASFFGRVSYVDVELDAGLGSADDDGFGLAAGIRGMVHEKIELQGQIERIDLGDGDDTQFEVQALYNFTPKFSAGLTYRTGDDFDWIGIGGRFYWGKN